MFGLETLDVAIGLVFVYLVLSLICTSVNEAVESLFKLRASNLEQAVRELLDDSKGNEYAQKLYEHPLVYGLFRGTYQKAKLAGDSNSWRSWVSSFGGSGLPSYIPSRSFALALMDVVAPSKSNGEKSGAAGATTEQAHSALTLQNLRNSVNSNLSDGKLKQALLPLIDAAGDDVAQARRNIETWFNDAMDRASGWYKRKTQWKIFALALFVSITANANTFDLVNSLSNNPSMRQIIVSEAEKTAEKGQLSEEEVKKREAALKNLGLPLGWSNVESRWNEWGKANFQYWNWIFKHLLGWLITAFALSLGAPFWFDLLNKFMIVRSTVKPREKSPNEPPVDRK